MSDLTITYDKFQDIAFFTGSMSSEPAYDIVLQDTEIVSSQFIYNYFMANERVSEDISLGPSELRDITIARSVIEQVENGTLPRYNQIKMINKTTNKVKPIKGFIERNKDKIVFEDAPFGTQFSSVIVTDSSIQESVYNLLSGSDTINVENDISFSSPDEMISKTSPEIDLRTYKQQAEGYRYAPTDTRQEIVNAFLNDAKAAKLSITLSDLVISDVIGTIVNKQVSIYTDEFAGVLEESIKIQKEERALTKKSELRSDNWSVSVQPIQVRAATLSEKTSITSIDSPVHIGYIFEKYGQEIDGSLKTYDSIIYEDPFITQLIDSKVRYGGVYKYRARSIYMFTTMCSVEVDGSDTDNIVIAKFLVASEGAQSVVSCVEVIPPPAPVDINFIQTQEGLHISWNFPNNPQRDIKRFQLFKRKSVNEAFTLIREFYFDDSLSAVTSPENVPEELVVKTVIPTKSFIDTEFNDINDTFIYALCSIDARALSSGYSSQYKVSFNKLIGKIKIDRISQPDAPKTYPNIFITGDFFPDIIKDSNHSRIRLYFDPEYYDVMNEKGKSLSLINSLGSDLPSYRMNITELQLAQSKEIDIFVSNKISNSIFGIPISQGRLYTKT